MLDTISTALCGFVALMAARLPVLGLPGHGRRYAAAERSVLAVIVAVVAALTGRVLGLAERFAARR